jgi:hypothetical protein
MVTVRRCFDERNEREDEKYPAVVDLQAHIPAFPRRCGVSTEGMPTDHRKNHRQFSHPKQPRHEPGSSTRLSPSVPGTGTVVIAANFWHGIS